MSYPVQGAGLGLRRAFIGTLENGPETAVEFFEVAPENWMGVGGRPGKQFRRLSERHRCVCHGLTLNLGGFAPLDEVFLHRLKQFLHAHHIAYYSEHLGYCGDDGHLYDLMPIPFSEDAVKHVAARIRRTQDILEQRIAIENIAYYAAPGQEMSESDFINAVLAEADCDLLLDINNIYVNSVNHAYDAVEFLRSMPGERFVYAHIAGHHYEAEDLLVDSHGAEVADPVWQLLRTAYSRFGVFPTLLERDFDIPPLPELLKEVGAIAAMQAEMKAPEEARHAS